MTITSYTDEAITIMREVASEWTGTTPIAWPNTDLEPDGAAHIRVVIANQTAFNADIADGAHTVRYPGLLVFEIRYPIGGGEGPALEDADDLAALFRNRNLGGLRFRAPTVRRLGSTDGYYLVQVDCPFYRDSIHA